jgi:hypothetical protein
LPCRCSVPILHQSCKLCSLLHPPNLHHVKEAVKHIEQMCENGTLCFKMFQSFITVIEVWWINLWCYSAMSTLCTIFTHLF